jgi:methyl-accepting chemotaxis protein
VNEAVTHLDTLTQQNAAMAEESAASAQVLSSSSLSLSRSLEVFIMP